MPVVKKTRGGIEYLFGKLRETKMTITRVAFWKIPHHTKRDDISLKIGRYNKKDFLMDMLECENPRSELTLDDNEFLGLIAFLSENYEPFKTGVKKYIPIEEEFDPESIEHIKALFDNEDKKKVLQFVLENDILPDDLISSLQFQIKIRAIHEFEDMLNQDLLENKWQNWFKKNDWVLGSEFVKILYEREIDSKNIADYLMQAYDGFLDIVEIKRPAKEIKFWSDKKDHDNYVQSSELTKAITQATKYIYEVEREANSIKFLERVKHVKTIKPRCILIFGRSHGWDKERCEAYRILNSSFHNLTILTYDHVLKRAKRILGIEVEPKDEFNGNDFIEPL